MIASGPFLSIFPIYILRLVGKILRNDWHFLFFRWSSHKITMEFRCLSQIKADNLRGTLQMMNRNTMGSKILLGATFFIKNGSRLGKEGVRNKQNEGSICSKNLIIAQLNCSSAFKDTARIQNAIANFCALYLSTGFTLKQNHSENQNPKRCKAFGLSK